MRKKKNIFNYFAQSIVLKIYVLALFVTHLVLAHIVFQSYVLCFENDGSVVLESVSDTENCCISTSALMTVEYTESNIGEDCSFCDDVAISENCDEKYSITLKKTQSLIAVVLNINYTPYTVDKKDFAPLNKNEINHSPQLDSYKTVLLLI